MTSVINEFDTQINKIIQFLEKTESNNHLIEIQKKLDLIANKYQNDSNLGNKRYKLYQAQAMIHYRNGDNESAYKWIQESINIKGETYDFAEEFLEHINNDEIPNKNMTIPLFFGGVALSILSNFIETTHLGFSGGSSFMWGMLIVLTSLAGGVLFLAAIINAFLKSNYKKTIIILLIIVAIVIIAYNGPWAS